MMTWTHEIIEKYDSGVLLYKSVKFAGVFLATECTFFYTWVGVGRTALSLYDVLCFSFQLKCVSTQHSALSSIQQ
jgi:hypothetical protein